MMTQLAVRGHDLTTGATLEELPQQIAAKGIQQVQLALGISFPYLPSGKEQLNPGMGTHTKQLFAAENIQIAILSCYINMIHPDEEQRELLLQKFEAYIKHAKFFGASMVASETGCVLPEIRYTEENFTESAFQSVVASVKRLAAAGAVHNTLVAIEPGLNHPIYSIERMQALLEAVDSEFIGVILDATNLITAETYLQQKELVADAFAAFGEKIVAVHLKDFIIQNNTVVPVGVGQGVMDIAGILGIINQHKPYITIVLEETKDAAIDTAKQLIDAL